MIVVHTEEGREIIAFGLKEDANGTFKTVVAFPEVSEEGQGLVGGQPKFLHDVKSGIEPGEWSKA
jgi:hypothetical protein